MSHRRRRSLSALTALSAVVLMFAAAAFIAPMLGGGYSGRARVNDDPRSVALEAVVLEYISAGEPTPAFDAIDAALHGESLGPSVTFSQLRSLARDASASERTRALRTPAIRVQHGETGRMSWAGPTNQSHTIEVSPAILDDDVIRLAVSVTTHHESGTKLVMETAYTTTSGGLVAWDHLGIDADANISVLVAMRPTIIKNGTD